MATKPKPAAATPAAPAPISGPAPDESADALHGVLAKLSPLCDAHGAQLELPEVEMFVPGAMLHVHVHHPVSVERFVAEARACDLVDEVQVLPTGVRLAITVPAAEG